MRYTLEQLVSVASVSRIYGSALSFATGLGLPVTSWHTGDPTRSQYWTLAERLHAYELIVSGYVSSGFLDYAAADPERYEWLVLLAEQVYDYTAREATYATTTVTLTNTAGGLYEIEPGDLQFKSSLSDQTYRNTTGGTLASGPGTTLDVVVVADEPGSDSNAGAAEIDTLVTTLLGVTCSNAAAAVGTDTETSAEIVAGCRSKLGALSPAGPADAYDYVARNVELTGRDDVTRSRTYADSTTGDVTVYIAGPAGAVGGPAVAAVELAIVTWAAPLCITPTVATAAELLVPITYELWVYDSVGMTTGEIEDAVQTALEAFITARPIGGDIVAGVVGGRVHRSGIIGAIRAAFGSHFIDVDITAPAVDVPVADNEVPMLGLVTVTAVHLEPRP